MKRGLLIILFFVVILGCNTKNLQMEVETSDQVAPKVEVSGIDTGADCDIYKDQDKRFQCYKDYVNKKLDFLGCSDIADTKQKNICYTAVALHNVSYCNDIFKPLPRNKKEMINATFQCFNGVAIATEDYTICNRSNKTLWEDRCYTGLAKKTKDISMCDKTQEDSNAVECFSALSYMTDLYACDSTNNSKYDSDVRYRCYINFAVKKNSKIACNMINSEIWHDKCVMQLSVSEDNASMCLQIFRPKIRDECFRSFAVAKSDLSVCDIMSSKEEKYDCYREIAVTHMDLSMCELIELVGSKYQCYIDIARNATNVTICESIDSHDYRNECYVEIAVKTGDPSFCYAMKTKVGNKNECYHKVAIINNDETICDMIDYEYDLKACQEDVKAND